MMYAVALGHAPGIHMCWSDCETAIHGYSGAVYKKFKSLPEATQFLNKKGLQHSEICIHTGSSVLSLNEYCQNLSISTPAEDSYEPCTLFNIGRGLHVEATHYNGRPRIDIRIWNQEEEMKMRTRKGISLTLSQWETLLKYRHHIDGDFDRLREKTPVDSSYNLGEDTYATLTSPYRVINIRQWYRADDGVLKPGRKGITLRFSEWEHIIHLQHQLELIHPTLNTVYKEDEHYECHSRDYY